VFLSGEIEKCIRKLRPNYIPPSEEVVRKAFKRLGITKWSPQNPTGKKPQEVIERFNDYLKMGFEETLRVLEEYEEKFYSKIIFKELCQRRSRELDLLAQVTFSPSDFAYKTLRMFYPDLWSIFLSRSQSRKARGGSDFEYQVRYLLELADIPFEPQPKKYHIDLLIPNSQAFQRNRTRTLILSIKRTLRERWREVVEELYNTRSPNVYLLTADELISTNQVNELKKYNIHLVVWDEVKSRKFSNEPIVLGYSQLMRREIKTFMEFW
jgi:hypothetical protein